MSKIEEKITNMQRQIYCILAICFLLLALIFLGGCSDNEFIQWANAAGRPLICVLRPQGSTIDEKTGLGTAKRLSGQGEANLGGLHRNTFNLRGII